MYKFAEQHETDCMFGLTELAHELTGRQREKLGSCFKHYQLALRDNTKNKQTPNMMGTHVPVNDKEFQQYFLERRNAIAKALPNVRVHTVNNHAYISINELIDHIMGHGVDLDWYTTQEQNGNGMLESKAMYKMVNKLKAQHQYVATAKIGYIILWSDAFQVNFVRTKVVKNQT